MYDQIVYAKGIFKKGKFIANMNFCLVNLHTYSVDQNTCLYTYEL